jgi:hypothetical protein
MRNPSSFDELSIQETSTQLLLDALAVVPDAAAGASGGGTGVVAQAVLENGE